MNHKIATSKLRGAWLAAGGLIAGFVIACGGDDTATPSPGNDSGGSDTSTTQDSPSPRDSAAEADSTGPMIDSPAGETSTETSTPETGPDTGREGGNEAGRDSGDSGNSGDATVADADAEAAAPSPPMPLNLCPVLDADWALGVNPSNTQRVSTGAWGADITAATPNGVGGEGFAFLLTNDCNVNGIQSFLSGSGVNSAASYLDQVNGFNLQFFGCGEPDSGALSFDGLIPLGAQSHTFTVADLKEIAKLYAQAVNEEASINWAQNLPSPEPLTVDQINQIESLLAALEAALPGVNPSTTHFTLSTCGQDAGGDSGDAAAEGATEGGADAGGD
jgi:hypothetical protein